MAAHSPGPPTSPPPVPGFLVQAVLQAIQREGLDVPAADTGPLPPAFREPADFGIPGSQFRQLLATLTSAAGGRAVGLDIGQRITEPNLHVFGPVITASRTMRDAFDNCRALCSTMRYSPNGHLDVRSDEVRWVMGETSFGPVWEDIVIALCYHAARRFIGSALPNVEPTNDDFSVYFWRPIPSNVADYERCFGRRVHFDAGVTALGFPLPLLDLPRPGTDAALAGELRVIGSRRLQPLKPANTWTARLESSLRELGALSHVDFQKLAARWGISQRSLRRRLSVEGTSLAQVLERVRFDRALYYLRQPDASIPQIAEILGYSETTSFRRAFKRWSGYPPLAYRAMRAADTDV